MSIPKLSLSTNPKWRFNQPAVGLRAPIMRVPVGKKKGTKRLITASNSCRESVVTGVRQALNDATCQLHYANRWGHPSWEKIAQVTLEDTPLRQPGESYLTLSKGVGLHPNGGGTSQKVVEDWLKTMDAITGPIGVLMSPDRFVGNWWDTSYQEACSGRNGKIRWYGIDSNVLHHPALVSLFTGLARHCAFLVRAGQTAAIYKQVPRAEVRRALTNSDPELALDIVNRLRPWIATPVPTGGYVSNNPVPSQMFGLRILKLHQAIYRHGFDKTFGGDFSSRWALEHDESCSHRYSGIHTADLYEVSRLARTKG